MSEAENLNTLKMTKTEFIPFDQIEINPDNSRKCIDDDYIAWLADSINKEGLQRAIHVCKDDDSGKYLIYDGECRYRAIKLLIENGQLTEIPDIKCDVFVDKDAAVWWMRTNAFRNDPYKPMESSDNIFDIIRGLDPDAKIDPATGKLISKVQQKQIIQMLRIKSPSTLSELLSLQRLPDNIKNEQAKKNNIPLRELRKLATSEMVSNPEEQTKRYEELMKLYPTKKEKINEQKMDNTPKTEVDKTIKPGRARKIRAITNGITKTKDFYLQKIDFTEYNPFELQEMKKAYETVIGDINEISKRCKKNVSELDKLIDKVSVDG